VKQKLFFLLAVLFSATMSPGLALDGSGGRFDRDGSCFDDSLGYSDDEYVSRGRAGIWDMRFLTDVAMEHPDTFSIINTDGKRLRRRTAPGEYSTTAYEKMSRATEEPITWFLVFKEFLITNFHPKVRGAAGFRARLTNGRLERIYFYGCRANMNLALDKECNMTNPAWKKVYSYDVNHSADSDRCFTHYDPKNGDIIIIIWDKAWGDKWVQHAGIAVEPYDIKYAGAHDEPHHPPKHGVGKTNIYNYTGQPPFGSPSSVYRYARLQ
jgi:hypothetical protein